MMLRHALAFAAVVSVSPTGFAAGATFGQLRNHAVLGAVLRLMRFHAALTALKR